ncbi:hypothetical protein F5Y12DRAFT_640019 [Xylaria sp. FL1777]|nr:hypothetical protein F5Y12DRAFT_640019 [Xylaria sp. FL1777]
MTDYDYIEITSGPRYVRSHRYHHGQRQYRARHPENCARVTVDEWNDVVDRERTARSTHDTLKRHNHSLKADLTAIFDENQRLRSSRRDLQSEVEKLRVSYTSRVDDDTNLSARLRRRMTDLRAEVDTRDLALRDLRREKDFADRRVRIMSRTITDQGAELTHLEDELARMKRIHKRDRRDLGVQTEAARDAWGFAGGLQRRLSDYRSFPFRSWY